MQRLGDRLGGLTAPREFSRGEFALALLGLVLLGGLAYLSHIVNGGFHLDDWSDASNTLFPGEGTDFGRSVELFYDATPYRPGLTVYVPLKYLVFGADTVLQLSLSTTLAIGVAALLYGVLRTLRVPWFHALMIAALTIVFPSYDSTRFWEAASLPSVALAFALGGLWLALHALDRRSWPLHAAAAALYLASILTYEITLPLIAAFGLIYVARVGWSAARWRWAVDLLVVVVAGTWNLTHTVRVTSGLSDHITHAGEIFEGSQTVLASAAYPLGSSPPTSAALIVLSLIFAVGLAAHLTQAQARKVVGWGLREWLILGATGLAVAVLGWVVFIPADIFYTPSLYAATNRVNAVAGIGLIMIVYAAIGTVVSVLSLYLHPLRHWAPALVLGLALVLGAAYIHVLKRHSDVWNAAYSYETAALEKIKATYPTLPPETLVVTSDYPANLSLGVPVFTADWDLNGALRLEYDDYSMRGLPLIEGSSLVCEADGLAMEGAVTTPETIPWDKVRLLNLADGHHTSPRSRAECEAAAPRFHPGPTAILGSY
ncbi:MAG TPA: hypothetical protein VFI03_05170 [Solirubrobacterales bacterium]|nr:hypothetical protein [Solirubrobacterales bacterium]